MGLLSKNKLQKINTKHLKELGFFKTPWGSPDGRYNNGHCKWNNEHMCWEYFNDEYDWYYKIIIYYYPKHFNAYVTPFSMHGQNPAGSCLICIESPAGVSYETKMAITYYEDMIAAITYAEHEIKKLNKKYGY